MSFFNVESDPPNIATRCSVFAKSDLIHHQQEGYSNAAMWSGLCRGMTRTLLGTLLNGRPLTAPVSVIGGVARNAQVIYWLEMAHPGLILVPADAHLIAALGAAELAQPVSVEIIRPLTRHKKCGNRDSLQDWLLTLEKSNYPSFETEENFTDEAGTEIRLVNWPARPQTITVVLGLDIGSTSTKAALVDGEGRVIVDLYRQTGGAPIEATQQLFRALQNLEKMRGMSFQIEGVGTTGSGRKMVGRFIGADAIINEISAHVAGAVATDPKIDTIFEIGGQDSKYMHLVNGHIRDSNMNYVCAAGTGSFVEAVSNKLGYPVATVGSAVLGRRPLATADRCTVFMEQDVERLIRAGCEPEDVLAGVMVSVIKNYLKQVVGNRPYNRERLFFQGATARNPALVAAFEHLLGVTVVVSPYCHVMGAYGVALLTRRSMAERSVIASRFRGLHLEKHRIEILYETCTLCQNNCKIASAAIEGMDETPSWGYMCGRDPTEQQVRINFHDQPMRTRQRLWQQAGSGVPVPEYARVVGIPAALTNYSFLPLWRRFFNRLGYRIQLSGQSNAQVRELGTRLAGADFCFPAKVAVGHVAKLAEDEGVDFIFLPHMISDQPNTHTTAAKFCPYVQALPTYSATAMELNGLKTSHLLRPSVDMRQHTSRQVTQLHRHLAGTLAVNRRQVHAAWLEGLASQQHFTQACREEGQKILSRSRENGEKLLVLLGRSYNIHDPGLNLGLPSKLEDLGRQTLPMDFLDYNLADLGEQYCNTYWSYGQRILAACQRVAGDQALDAIYLTNFNCGPDSFLLTYAEEIFANKPLLSLELDEHGADAGYMTRIEAFFEVLRQPSQGNGRRAVVASEPLALKQRIIWIPCLHPVSTGLFAAAFHSFGFDARPLPPEDRQAFEIGRSLTRGSECLPTALTVGSFVKAVRDSGEPPHRHAEFMPTAEGPCRFGQYCTLHRQVLDRIGMAEVAVLSPSSSNSYQGLPEAVRRYLWQAMLAGDLLHKAVCKVRPYEVNSGETNRVLTEEQAKLEQIAAVRGNLRKGLSAAVARFAAIERRPGRKPLVGIVGEIYVRCNTYANENVIDAIERFGGEA